MGRGAFEQAAWTRPRLLGLGGGAAARGLAELGGDGEARVQVAELRLGAGDDDFPGKILAAALRAEFAGEVKAALLGEQQVVGPDDPAFGVGVFGFAEASPQGLLGCLQPDLYDRGAIGCEQLFERAQGL